MFDAAFKSILDQGVLGAILVVLFLLFKRFIEQLFQVVKSNTKAMEQVASAMQQMKETINRCHERGVV